MAEATQSREWPKDYARVVPFADVVALIDERNRLTEALARAERECERWKAAARAGGAALAGIRKMRAK